MGVNDQGVTQPRASEAMARTTTRDCVGRDSHGGGIAGPVLIYCKGVNSLGPVCVKPTERAEPHSAVSITRHLLELKHFAGHAQPF